MEYILITRAERRQHKIAKMKTPGGRRWVRINSAHDWIGVMEAGGFMPHYTRDYANRHGIKYVVFK